MHHIHNLKCKYKLLFAKFVHRHETFEVCDSCCPPADSVYISICLWWLFGHF